MAFAAARQAKTFSHKCCILSGYIHMKITHRFLYTGIAHRLIYWHFGILLQYYMKMIGATTTTTAAHAHYNVFFVFFWLRLVEK